jgi:hypothetical protein
MKFGQKIFYTTHEFIEHEKMIGDMVIDLFHNNGDDDDAHSQDVKTQEEKEEEEEKIEEHIKLYIKKQNKAHGQHAQK